MHFRTDVIGYIETPYRQKFAIPRQPGLVKEAEGIITMTAEYKDINAFRGIEQYSHLWLLFRFHKTAEQGWSPLVRPPRLGGNQKQGVFSTRSTFRPNAIGMSVVEFVDLYQQNGETCLKVAGADLLNDTPILDIKPYIPYADAIPQASGGIAPEAPDSSIMISFSPQAAQQLQNVSDTYPSLAKLIEGILRQDPRPAYQKDLPERVYGMTLYDLNIQWQIQDQCCQVIKIEKN